MLDELVDELELELAGDDEPLLFPDDEEAGAAAAADADGALAADSVFAVVVDVGEGFDASPEGGFILSE